jgi:hypothetical protein
MKIWYPGVDSNPYYAGGVICRRERSVFGEMVPRAGLEPATLGLEVLCSIQLSYRG